MQMKKVIAGCIDLILEFDSASELDRYIADIEAKKQEYSIVDRKELPGDRIMICRDRGGQSVMPKIQYKEINFRGKSLELINLVNQVINEYKNQGYELTLRQTYYQLVARGYIPNNERSYKNIGNLINDGRLAGLIDWYSIVDRTRNLRGRI